MRRLVPLSLVALLLLSGCLGALGGDATSTPEEIDPADADLPPGVTVNGVENASALAAAHDETLLDEGFVFDGTVVTDQPGSGIVNETATVVVGVDAETLRSDSVRTLWPYENRSVVSQRVRDRLWLDGDEQFVRTNFTTRDSVIAGPYDASNDPRDGVTRASTYEGVLDAANFTVESTVARDGHTFTTLVAADANGTEDDPAYDGHLVVDERGVVHEAVVEIDRGPESVWGLLDYRLVELGASPEEPDWVDGVRESADLNLSFDAEFLSDHSAVGVTNTGDDAVPAGTELEVDFEVDDEPSATTAPTVITLDETIDPGETVYVYRSGWEADLVRSRSTAIDDSSFYGDVGVQFSLDDVSLGGVRVTQESNDGRTGRRRHRPRTEPRGKRHHTLRWLDYPTREHQTV
ncbi:hypothetical protein [Halomarina rubra]|uniref:Uncharacterized protein n=1 Tax=Halomarina rubra TaxID=2071873 RepID=A0ABD6AXZ3_9EURY|nr:hypothetical protein [Halomarina rubra]